MIISKISLSDLDFSQKIMRKYQKGKSNFLNFPLLFFSKNAAHALSMDFKLNILMQLNFHNQRIISHVESISGYTGSISEFLPGQFKRSIVFFNNLNHIYSLGSNEESSRESAYSFSLSNQILRHFILSVIPRSPAAIGSFTKNHNSKNIFSYNYINKYIEGNSGLENQLSNAVFSQRNIAVSGKAFNNQNLSFDTYIRNINLPIFRSEPEKSEQHYSSNKKNFGRYSSSVVQQNIAVSGEYPDTILLKFATKGKYYSSQKENFASNNLFENNLTKYILKYNISLLKNHNLNHIGNNNSFSSSSFISFKRRDMENNGNFYFQDQRQIDRKIEQIKKISEEAKEIVSQKFSESSSGRTQILPEIDINQLSNKVYKMIEYNLKIEKERRGYL